MINKYNVKFYRVETYVVQCHVEALTEAEALEKVQNCYDDYETFGKELNSFNHHFIVTEADGFPRIVNYEESNDEL